METGIIDLHGLVKWAVLLGLMVSTLFSILGLEPKNADKYNFKTAYLFTLAVISFQVVIGLVVYFNSSLVAIFWSNPVYMAKNPRLLFLSIVHPVFMLIALVSIVCAYRLFLGGGNPRRIALYCVLALFLVLGAIPWEFYGFIY